MKIDTRLGPILFLIVLIPALTFIALSISRAVETQVSFGDWQDALRKEASQSGISDKTLDSALTDLQMIPRVIQLDRNQPESKLTLDEYLCRVVSENRIAEGREKLRENRILLSRIAARYGVQPRFLVALWGIETDFGRITDSFPVIDSLATLAYNGRRSSYFRREYLHALRILDEGHISIERMKGSWAGAMGQIQFMPSTFNHFAVDFNGDGRKDIWKDYEDAFASAANYLSRSGWKGDQTWGREVRLPDGIDLSLVDFDHQRHISEWQALGVRRPNGRNLPTRDLLSSIVLPDGTGGQAFLVYSNYRAILKWNRSHKFAISVGILSDRIGAIKN
jgi:membrane-bound lytic murein transglycosylase B